MSRRFDLTMSSFRRESHHPSPLPRVPTIRLVTTDAQLRAARRLFAEYARSLPFALDFQGFQEELNALPGEYAPPDGSILLAEAERTDPNADDDADAFAGCVALRPLAADDADDRRLCEMKRLYVRPAHRGRGLGRTLVDAVLDEARRRGYDAMRLDTVASMNAANALYRALGFREIAPYRHNPLDAPVFFEKDLDPQTA